MSDHVSTITSDLPLPRGTKFSIPADADGYTFDPAPLDAQTVTARYGIRESAAIDTVLAAREFAVRYIRPVARHHDRTQDIAWDLIRQACQASIYTPEYFMSMAFDTTGLLAPAIAEEMAWGDPGLGLLLMYPALPFVALATAGTPEQVLRWAPRLFGTPEAPVLSCFVASEPHAGSDLAAISMNARRDGDSWVLNGVKRWGGNAGIADLHLVVASVDPSLGSRGQAIFVIPRTEVEGLRIGPRFDKLGLRATWQADLFLDDVRVPLDHVLGGIDKLNRRLEQAREGVHQGGQQAMRTFEGTRPLIAAMAVGTARAAHEWTLAYAQHRHAFGRPIAAHQAVGFTLARQRTRIDAARLLVQRAASMQAAGQPLLAAEGSQSKLFAADVASEVTSECVEILGGIGFTESTPVERWYRDAPIYNIYEGTRNINQLVIARAITGLRLD
jgi:alkylation response protein AidB-like acyl-CoA dehydrogenase